MSVFSTLCISAECLDWLLENSAELFSSTRCEKTSTALTEFPTFRLACLTILVDFSQFKLDDPDGSTTPFQIVLTIRFCGLRGLHNGGFRIGCFFGKRIMN